MLTITPLAQFDSSHFTKRELDLMNRLVSEFRDALAEDIIEATHLENLPWHKVYVEEGRKQEIIPYEYALRKQESEAMTKVIAERKAFVEHFSRS